MEQSQPQFTAEQALDAPYPVRVVSLTGVLRRGRWRLNLPHAEPQPVLLWITRGHSRVTAAARTRGLGPNVAVFIPAFLPWSFEPGPNLQATLTYLPTAPITPFPERARMLRVHDIERQAELTAIVDTIARPGPAPGSNRIILAQCLLLSAWMSRNLPTKPPGRPNRANTLAEAFATTVEAHMTKGANLAAIGADMGVTPTHLTRTTKATCGQSAASYLTDRVMHEARLRLADTDESAASIARALGFSSPAYFSRAFATHAGQTPGAFRAPHRAHARQGADD